MTKITSHSIWLSLAFPLLVSAQPNMAVARTTELPNSTSTVPNVWSGGALLRLENAYSGQPSIHVLDAEGTIQSRTEIKVPGATIVQIADGCFARAYDGTLAVCGAAYNEKNQGVGFIARIQPGNSVSTVIRTSPYAARRIAVLGDGTMWTIGREQVDGREVNPGHHIVRRFDAQGNLIGSWLPASAFTVQMDKHHPTAYSKMAASRNRVGILSRSAQEYVEFDSRGSVTERVPLPPSATDQEHISGLAMCDGGETYVTMNKLTTKGPTDRVLLQLDRAGRKWVSVGPKEGAGYLLGCQGATVLSAGTRLGGPVIRWVEHGK